MPSLRANSFTSSCLPGISTMRSKQKPSFTRLLCVGEAAHAAIADVLEERRLIQEAENERRVLHREATEHLTVGLEHNHGWPPPEDRDPAPEV
ncbi:MAG: hypothetical protein MUE61_14665 [Vicinamibacterales bacterium]|nr:hypothetical protein [Vicinamibacterales bacterium]